MKTLINKIGMLSLLVAVGLMGVSSLSSCKKEGCTDPKATNFDEKAKEDDGSCEYDTVVIVRPNTENLKKIAEFEESGLNTKVALYAKTDLIVGHNTLYFAATDMETGAVLDDGHFEVKPMMSMDAGHEHGAPVISSALSAPNDDGLYEMDVYFVMGSMGGKWRLETKFHNHAASGDAEKDIEITVSEPSDRLSGSFMATDDSSRIFVCWVMKEDPIVGMNDFEVAVFKRESMMSWPAVDGLSIEIEPEMPTMGHGSPGNVDPTGQGDGIYSGKVNFTMTGYWKVNIDIKRGGNSIVSDFYLDYTL